MPRPSLLLKKPPPPEPCQPSNPLHPLKMRVAVLVSLLLCIALAHVAKADSSGSASANDYNNWLLSSVYKRPRFSDPSDPRNLFSAVYGYRKRMMAEPLESYRNLYGPMEQKRRGLRDPLDPRNLFRAVYGFRKRK